MFIRIILISLTIMLSCACSGGSKKHNEANRMAAPAEQITEEDYNLIGENLQAFLSQNATLLKKWAFKEWGDKIPKPKGIRITGDELKEFLSIDKVNRYRPIHNVSRSEWVERLLDSDVEYMYCGTLDLSDSLDCYIYMEEDKEAVGACDAFALLVKNGSVTDTIQLACEGYGMWDSIESNRISRNTIVISSSAVDIVDEDGNNPETYYAIRINDDGSTSWSNASKSDFNKPTWNR